MMPKSTLLRLLLLEKGTTLDGAELVFIVSSNVVELIRCFNYNSLQKVFTKPLIVLLSKKKAITNVFKV